VSCRGAALLALAAAALLAGAADATTAPEPASARDDCRYLTTEDRPAARGAGRYEPGPFPPDDVFRPLLADPKQPQFFAAYQRLERRDLDVSIDAGSVGFGEYFGLWGYRREAGCDGLQVGVAGAVFAQFDLDAASTDLINADYLIGVPVTARRGFWSARLRAYHQSSHIGDEFLLGNPDFRRLNLSFEEVDALVSFERRWARLYAGGGALVNKEPSTLRPGKAQWGAEWRGPALRPPLRDVLEKALGPLRLVPVAGADFKAFEELGWTVETSLAGGLEWSGERSARRLRLLATLFRGHNPYGQFFEQKVLSFGVGLYFAF
jgi:hypothetical protein